MGREGELCAVLIREAVLKMQYKRFPLGALWTNGYLFWDEDGEAFFIDPGGDASEVLKFVKAHNLKLRKVLLTHGHLDHIADGDLLFLADFRGQRQELRTIAHRQ